MTCPSQKGFTMYKIRYSVGLKILAAFLFIISFSFAVLSAVGIFVMASENVYLDGGRIFTDALWENTLQSQAASAADDVYTHYKYAMDYDDSGEAAAYILEDYQETYGPDETNMRFSIEADGEEIFSTGQGEGTYAEVSFDYRFYWTDTEEYTEEFETFQEMDAYVGSHGNAWDDYNYEIIYPAEGGEATYYLYYQVTEEIDETIWVNAWVDEIQVMDVFYWVDYLSDSISGLRWSLIVVGFVSLALCVTSIVYLFCGAGHKSGSEEIVLHGFHRIPFDLYAVGIVLCCTFLGYLISEAAASSSVVGAVLSIGLLLVGIVLLALVLLLSMAARLKAGVLWKNTVCYRIFSFLWRILRRIGKRISYICKGLPLVWKVGLIYAALSLVELIFVASAGRGYLLLAWCVEKLILTPLLALVLINMKQLKRGAEEIADGNLQYQVKLPDLIGDFRKHGETLNRIGDGMQVALERQMQSERLKTELITNVSHDIKTPLTSIINYVDLLKKEGMDGLNAPQYLEVLERQSARLKKLTEDLVEASKASSGSIHVVKVPTNIQVLLEQAVGEYEERLAGNGIQVVFSPCEEQICILADGRLLWRVFDNLMNNICKYALAGTRVYVNMEHADGVIRIIFKNISAYPLNISGDELMERFVRGDRSRNTEGSGLGLSIARSLMELQGGALNIQIDGDLFKSVITIPDTACADTGEEEQI